MEDERKSILMIGAFVLVAAIVAVAGYNIYKIDKDIKEKMEVPSEDEVIKRELNRYCANLNADGEYKDEAGGCVEFTCYLNYDGDAYIYDCKDPGSKIVKEKKEDINKKSNLMLSSVCSMVDADGYLAAEYDYSCKDFVCEINLYGKTYTKDCRE